MNWVLKGGDVLDDEGFERRDLFVQDGVIADRPTPDARVLDASGLILAPGMVDLHGDAFERSLSPRPGVAFDVETALIDADRQALINGVTTPYLAVTISWEPGLRSLATAEKIIDAWRLLRPHFATDMRLQLRWEIFALAAVEAVEGWLNLSPKPTLAFNDHFTMLLDPDHPQARDVAGYARRAGMSVEAYNELTARTAERADDAPAAVVRLARAAAANGAPRLAHDERTAETRRANRALGIGISEFPLTREAAAEAIEAGEPTIFGAPNVVRGGSHIGALSAEAAAEEGLCMALASDYFYPAMLSAAVGMINRGRMTPPAIWRLVSGGPSRAVGLSDRGVVRPGARADLVAFRKSGSRAVVEGCMAGGRLAFSRLSET